MELNESLRIRDLVIRNRLAVPPMVCFHWTGDDGYMTEKTFDHYEALARGGFGLIIVEATAVTRRSRLHQTEAGLWEDGQIDGYAEIARRIHAHGAKAFVQLLHAGCNGIDTEAETASDCSARWGITGHEMTTGRIRDTVQDFVQAALRAEKAGFDGIELHGCHGYLLSQFMNSRSNHRTDEYGAEKTLLAKEVLTAVRAACGKNMIIGIRLAAFEPLLEDGLAHAEALAPYTDFLDISYGGDNDPEKPADFPYSPAVYGALRVKQMLPQMPVFAVHGINSREDAIGVLSLGIDMVDVGHAALVDPAFAEHVIAGVPAGKCLSCPKGCRWNPDEMQDPDRQCPGAVLFARQNH